MPSDTNLQRKTFPPPLFFFQQKRDKNRGSHGCRCPRHCFSAWALPLQISVLKIAKLPALNPAFRLRLLDAPSRVKPEAISNTNKGGYDARHAVGIFQPTGFAPCEGDVGAHLSPVWVAQLLPGQGGACPRGEDGWEEDWPRWPGRRPFPWLQSDLSFTLQAPRFFFSSD